MRNTIKVTLSLCLLFTGVLLSGCQSETKPEASPSATPAAAAAAAAPAKAESSNMGTGVEAAPAGVSTDLKGGLK